MKKSLNLIKFLGAGFLSLGAISISAAAINHTYKSNTDKADAAINYSDADNYHAAGNAWSLFTTLQSLTYTTKTFSYAEVWTTYGNIYYTDSAKHIKDYYSNTSNFVYSTNQCGNYKVEGDCYNREHSIPKSWWGSGDSAKTKQGADPIIVIPTDGKINSYRSNYPLGVVDTSESYSYSNNEYSKWGPGSSTYGYTSNVFEPNDEIKGDLARIVFYACVRYSSRTSNYVSYPTYNWRQETPGQSTFNGIEPTQSNNGADFCLTDYAIKLFTKWHNDDKPDDWERTINERFYNVQSNKNPFIDRPEYVNTLWGSNSNATEYTDDTTPSTDPTITINPTSLTLTESGSTGTITATITNGSGDVTWESSDTDVVTVAGSGTNNTTCTVTPVAAGTATITASYSTATHVTCSVTVNSSGGGGGGDDPEETTDVLFAKGFGDYTTNSYSAAGTDRTGLANATNNSGSTYAMQVFNGSSGAVRGNQSGASNFSVRNTTTYSDYYIASVSLTVSGGTLDGSTSGRSVVYFGTSAYSNPNTTAPSGTSTTASPASSGQSTLTWTNTDTTKNYFILYNLKTSSTALSESASTALTVTWSPVSGGDDPTLTGITIKTAPTKTTYTSGEFFSPTNLVITTNYSDSSYDTDVSYAGHTSDFTFSPSLSTALKTNNDKVTITYGGKSADQAITVNPSSITASPKKDTYYVGETISAEDITVTDNDGFDVTGFTFSPTSYQFVYGDSSAGGIAKNKTFTNAVSYANKTASVTFSVNRQAYVTPSSTQEVTDTITAADLTATGTTYTDFSNVTITSDAEYAGQSAKDASGNIQLRSKNSNSGLVSTTSGGTIKSVKITVGSGSNTIDVYGKNTAYTDATDLYSSSTQGTKVGYLTSTGTITFTTDYEFVGIRSNNGAIYISSIDITYKGSSGKDNALNVSNFIMYEDTNNQCNTKLDQAITKLNTMPETEKDLFWTPGNNYVIATAKTRLQAWATSKGKTLTYEDGEYSVDGAKFNIMFKHTDSSSLTLILIMISITSTMVGFIFVGYYLKKKER